MGLVVLAVGVVGLGAVMGAVVVFAVLRSRRNSSSGRIASDNGIHPQNMGYPPQQHMHSNAQQPYPSNPHHGHPVSPSQFPQSANPYAQQPPHQG